MLSFGSVRLAAIQVVGRIRFPTAHPDREQTTGSQLGRSPEQSEGSEGLSRDQEQVGGLGESAARHRTRQAHLNRARRTLGPGLPRMSSVPVRWRSVPTQRFDGAKLEDAVPRHAAGIPSWELAECRRYHQWPGADGGSRPSALARRRHPGAVPAGMGLTAAPRAGGRRARRHRT